VDLILGWLLSWDEVIARLRPKMGENNIRPSTIDDYLDTIQALRHICTSSKGPSDITAQKADEFKSDYHNQQYFRQKETEPKVWKGRGRKPKPRPKRVGYSHKANTVASRIRKLHAIWSKWLIGGLKCAATNPWSEVTTPKLDKVSPRVLSPEEIQDFFNWLAQRWHGWQLPILFFVVKGYIGNRIMELCSLATGQLQEGRIVFPADEVKGRKEAKAIIPEKFFEQLKAIAGPAFLWERYPEQLREHLRATGKPCHMVLPVFSPERLKSWLQDEIDDYCKAHPHLKRFSAHAFRKTAMTKAWRLGIPVQQAAIAFRCNARTMLAHYVLLDETETRDHVLTAVAKDTGPLGPTVACAG
jgi:integrase